MVARPRELHGRWLHGLSNVCVRGETRSSEHSSTDEHHISALLELLPHRGTRSSCQTCREHQDSRRLVVSSTWCRLACMHSSGCAAAWNRALNGRLTCLLRADGDAPTQSTTRVRMGLKVFLVVATLPHRQSVRAADLHVFDQDRRLEWPRRATSGGTRWGGAQPQATVSVALSMAAECACSGAI